MRLPTRLLRRSPDTHKRDYGHLFILAGSARYSGAAVLCAQACLRAGAGLVTLGIPKSLLNAMIRIKPPEVICLPLAETKELTLSLAAFKKIEEFSRGIDVLAIGPGLSQNKSTQSLVRKVVAKIAKPMVIDADGLNALANVIRHCEAKPKQSQKRDCFAPCTISAHPPFRYGGVPKLAMTKLKRPLILTPHPGEMARLLGISVEKVQSRRRKIAAGFAKDHACTVVLKGDHTIVADSQGSFYLNQTGNPGMATAGTGDVLTGMIAAFLGQGLEGFCAAKYAVYLHGLAGDIAAKEKTEISLIASDIIAKIPEAVKRCS